MRLFKKKIKNVPNSVKNEEQMFEKLTPSNTIKLGVYKDSFNYISNNNDITNVAITGGYGSGKSSLLETYAAQNKNFKFLRVSLADSEFVSCNKWNDLKKLEGKIFNHLIYQIPHKKIPKINSSKSRKESIFSILLLFILSASIILSSILVSLRPRLIRNLEPFENEFVSKILCIISSHYFLFAGVAIGIVAVTLTILKIVILSKNRKLFKKISIGSGGIELFAGEDESYFDKYLGEIIYVLENSSFNNVVFEDLDRNKNELVFKKLREINQLVNFRKKNKAHIRRFFLFKMRKSHCLNWIYTKTMLWGMRWFHETMEISEPLRFFYLLSDELFERDERTKFFDLIIPAIPYVGTSNAYERITQIFIKSKKEFKFDEKFIRDLSLYLVDMRLIKNIYNEFLVYEERINYKTDSNIGMRLDLNKLFAIVITKNIFPCLFSSLIEESGLIEEIIKNKDEFIDEYDKNRKELKNNGQDSDARNQIIEEGYDFLSSDAKIMFDEIIDDKYFDLLIYFVRYGFIEKDYPNYLTRFVEGRLTKSDGIFIRSVKDNHGEEFGYQLVNLKSIVSYFDIEDFGKYSAWNFDLLNHIVRYSDYEKQEEEMFASFIEKKAKAHDFIKQMFVEKDPTEYLVYSINYHWPSFFSEIFDTYPTETLIWFARVTLKDSESDTLNLVNINDCLTEFISEQSELLNITEVNDELIENLMNLDVKFKDIEFTEEIKDIFAEVYDNKLYELSLHNINLMLEYYHGVKAPLLVKTRNYSLIKSEGESVLSDYVEENIKTYLQLIMQQDIATFNDEEEYVLLLLNNEKLIEDDVESRENVLLKYISKMSTKISDINMVTNQEVRSELLKKQLLEYNAVNIKAYFIYHGIEVFDNEDYINFINGGTEKVDFDEILKDLDDEKREVAFNKIVAANKLSDERYNHIIGAINLKYTRFSISSINSEKMDILIGLERIELNEPNLEFILENYSVTLTLFESVMNSEAGMKIKHDYFAKYLIEIKEVDKCNEYLKLLGLTKIAAAFISGKGSQPRIEVNDFNTKLMDEFKRKGWIDSKNKRNNQYQLIIKKEFKLS